MSVKDAQFWRGTTGYNACKPKSLTHEDIVKQYEKA